MSPVGDPTPATPVFDALDTALRANRPVALATVWATPFSTPSHFSYRGLEYSSNSWGEPGCVRQLPILQRSSFLPRLGVGSIFGYLTSSKPILQPTDMTADARFREVQRPRGSRKSALLNDRRKEQKIIEVVHALILAPSRHCCSASRLSHLV